ncbi:hypothetical protein HDU81_002664 [Chytriomyces hyalinus]|nr:hypothetical protein HDU81_002664 [Chytriomyces hyalinus]
MACTLPGRPAHPDSLYCIPHSSTVQVVTSVDAAARVALATVDAGGDSSIAMTAASSTGAMLRLLTFLFDGCDSMPDFRFLVAASAADATLPLFSPLKNPSNSEWVQVGDLLPILKSGLRNPKHDDLLANCLAWSHVASRLNDRAAFLAVGTRKGTISVFRMNGSNVDAAFIDHKVTPVFELSFTPFDGAWVSKLAWSQWVSMEGAAFKCSAAFLPQVPTLIRVAISKGSKLSVWTAPTPDLNDAVVLASQSETWLSSSINLPILMPVGGITWSVQGDELRIYSVDGIALTIALIQVKSLLDALDETDNDEFEPTEKGGRAFDALAILEDVTLQLYKEILGQTALGGDGDEDNAEGGNAEVRDAAASSGRQLRFYGAVTTANGLADLLLYTMGEYEGLEYRTEKTNRCFIIIHWKYAAKLPSNVGHLLVDRFTQMANIPDLFHSYSSGYLFWDILSFRNLHRKESTLEDLINRIMETLQCSADHFQDSPPLAVSTDASSSPHTILEQVPKHLFLNRGMNCLRLQNHLKLGLINSMPGAKKTETAVSLLANYKSLLRDYISTLLIAVQVYLSDSRIAFSDTDTLMLTLLTDWCLSNHESVPATLKPIIQIFATLKHRCQDADIQALCDEYILKIRKTVSSKKKSVPESTELESQPHLESKEECLACRGTILFSSPWKAVCANGHAWDRCAVSLLTAATPKMRSCLGCNRKSISPLALYSEDEMEGVEVEQQQDAQQSILMRGMLGYMNSCIYCANRLRS